MVKYGESECDGATNHGRNPRLVSIAYRRPDTRSKSKARRQHVKDGGFEIKLTHVNFPLEINGMRVSHAVNRKDEIRKRTSHVDS